VRHATLRESWVDMSEKSFPPNWENLDNEERSDFIRRQQEENPPPEESSDPKKEDSQKELEEKSLSIREKRIRKYASWIGTLNILQDADIEILITRLIRRLRHGDNETWEKSAKQMGMGRDQFRKRHERSINKLQQSDVHWPPPSSSTDAAEETPLGGLDGWGILRKIKVRGVAIAKDVTIATLLERLFYLVEHTDVVYHQGNSHKGRGVAYLNSAAINEVRSLLGLRTGLTSNEVNEIWVGRTGESLQGLDESQWTTQQLNATVMVPSPPTKEVKSKKKPLWIEVAS